jgi:hypothetical protein
MVARVKENFQHLNKIKKTKKKIELQRVTWESPTQNCAKKAHHKIKKKHHIAMPSRA